MNEPLVLLIGIKPPPVTPERVQALLDAREYTEAVDAIWHLGTRILQGELDCPMGALWDFLDRLPPPHDQDPRFRYLKAGFLHQERRNTLSLLLLDELAAECEAELNGPRAAEAAVWMLFVRMAQGTVCEHDGRWERSRAAYAEVRRYLPAPPANPPAALLIDPGEAQRLVAMDPTGIGPLLLDSLTLMQASGDRSGLARVAQNLGQAYLERGEPATARYWLEQALDLKRLQPGQWPRSLTLNALGVCYRQLGLLTEAAAALDEALRIATRQGSIGIQAAALSNLGDVYRDREAFEPARELYRKSLSLKESARDTYGMARTHLSQSVMYRRAGQFGLAADCAVEARMLGLGHGNPVLLNTALVFEQAAGVLLESPTAAEALTAGVDRLTSLAVPHIEVVGRWYLALGAEQAGDPDRAARELRRALTLAAGCRQLSLLALELPVSASVCRRAAEQHLCPDGLAGLVQRASARGLLALLQEVPATRSLVEASGRLMDATALSVNLLGTFRVHRAGREIDLGTARSQKAVSLLKFLVAQRGRPAAREQILEAIWSESDPESADRSFEVTLSTLRRLMDSPDGSTLIIRRGRGYLLNPAVAVIVDVDQFAQHLDRGNWWWQRGQTPLALAEWEQAEGAYGGDFLADDPYEDWATADRERLREQYLDLVLRLGEVALQEGRCGEAVERAHRVLTADPIREAAYRLLMRAHARQGNRAMAVRDLARCSEVLRRELGEEPMPETRELAKRIRSGEYS